MYEVIFSRRSAKFVSDIGVGYHKKIEEIIKILGDNPYSYPYKKIRGKMNLYRIRVGKYRILYEVDREHNRVIILKLDKRDGMYE